VSLLLLAGLEFAKLSTPSEVSVSLVSPELQAMANTIALKANSFFIMLFLVKVTVLIGKDY
jgi:hypothetical protein